MEDAYPAICFNIAVKGDEFALFVFFRVAPACKHKAAGGFVGKLDFAFVKRPRLRRNHYFKQVAFNKGQHRLRFRIAETAVIFNNTRAVRCEHKSEIQAPAESPSFGIHCVQRGKDDALHNLLLRRFCVKRIRCNNAHAAGVQSRVAVARTFVVH